MKQERILKRVLFGASLGAPVSRIHEGSVCYITRKFFDPGAGAAHRYQNKMVYFATKCKIDLPFAYQRTHFIFSFRLSCQIGDRLLHSQGRTFFRVMVASPREQ